MYIIITANLFNIIHIFSILSTIRGGAMGFHHYWDSIRDKTENQLSEIREAMEHMIALGYGQNRISEELNRLGITTVMGTYWSQPKVSQYLKRLGLKTKYSL